MKKRWLFNMLVLAVTVYFTVSSLANLWKARMGAGPAIDPLPVNGSNTPSATPPSLEHYGILAERNLFGGSAEDSPPADEEVSLQGIPVAAKELGFELVGTVVSGAPEQNLAFIRNSSTRTEERYQEGDRIAKTQVKKILRNNVIIATERGDLVLTMDYREGEPGRGPAGGPPQTGQQESRLTRTHRLRRKPSTFSSNPDSERVVRSGNPFADALNRAMEEKETMKEKETVEGTETEDEPADSSPPEDNPLADAFKRAMEASKSSSAPLPEDERSFEVLGNAPGG